MTTPAFSIGRARRIALAAQGFSKARPEVATMRAVQGVIDRIALFQVDSVNVLVRAHHVPLFSRLGAYDHALLTRASSKAPRRMVEYWAHVAALVDVELWPAMQHKMESEHGMWGGIARIARDRPELVERVLAEVTARGPVTARDLEDDAERSRDHWGWNWSDGKTALEYLFFKGRISSAGRNQHFERRYDLPERVLPASVLARPALHERDAHIVLVARAARALGIATAQCLRDYFRLQPAPTKVAIDTLVGTGELVPTSIEGWKRPAYLHRDAARPRAVSARALLSPFDPLVFERTRTERLFDFRYRIEIYVPEAQRVHGYYVLPFLLGDRLVARVDLKADRRTSTLLVHGAWAETHAPADTAEELADELTLMARWLGLATVAPPTRGDLAPELTAALRGEIRDV